MESIKSSLMGNVLYITLNRPDVFNSFNRAMALQLQQVLDSAATDQRVRAICITGEGKAFSAGQDLQEVHGPQAIAVQTILQEHYNPIITRIRKMEKPVIAAVNGVAAGAGANIALCCDIVIAAQSASFIQAFSKIGLIPDSGGTYFLLRLIGLQKASALMMTGDKIVADEAERLGMVYKVFPDATFSQDVQQLCTKIGNMPTRGLALTKEALNRSMTHNLWEQLQAEDALQYQASQTKDYAEGVSAFLEKRPPQFTGS